MTALRTLKPVSVRSYLSRWDGRTVSTTVSSVTLEPRTTIVITRPFVNGVGADAWPEQEARVLDGPHEGIVGRIGFGVTVQSGFLEEIAG